MATKSKHRINGLILSYFQKGVSKRDAIGISIVLHFILGVAFALVYVSNPATMNTSKETNVEFELIPIRGLKPQRNNNQTSLYEIPKKADSAKRQATSIGSPSAVSKMLADATTVKKDAAMTASLASLMQLREPFNFLIQPVTSDSLGAFTPIQGSAPDTKFLPDGSEDGYSSRIRGAVIRIRGGGNGSCPPGGVLKLLPHASVQFL